MCVGNNEDIFDYICDCGYGYTEINDSIRESLQFIDLYRASYMRKYQVTSWKLTLYTIQCLGGRCSEILTF